MTKEKFDRIKAYYQHEGRHHTDREMLTVVITELIEALEQAWKERDTLQAMYNIQLTVAIPAHMSPTPPQPPIMDRMKPVDWMEKAMQVRDEGYGYLYRLLVAVAPQCQPEETLLGLATQIDNYITGVIKERDSAIMVGLRLKKLLEDAERECYELKCKEAFLEAVNHNLGKDKADLSAIKSNYLGLKAELQAWREGGLTEELLRKGDGTIKVGRGCVLISERDLEEKDAEIAALKAKCDASKQDVIAYRGALGYDVPGDNPGLLSDGTLPKNGLAEALTKELENLKARHDSLQGSEYRLIAQIAALKAKVQEWQKCDFAEREKERTRVEVPK